MRKSQWIVLGWAFLLLSTLFIYISISWRSSCLSEDLSGWNLAACIRSQIFAPFPYVFFILSVAFFINAWLEGKAEKHE
jgi:hypothetical protein